MVMRNGRVKQSTDLPTHARPERAEPIVFDAAAQLGHDDACILVPLDVDSLGQSQS